MLFGRLVVAAAWKRKGCNFLAVDSKIKHGYNEFDEEGSVGEDLRDIDFGARSVIFNEALTFFVGAALDLRGLRRRGWFRNC